MKWTRAAVVLAAGSLLAAAALLAQVPEDEPRAAPRAADPHEMVQQFPSKGKMRTAWKVRWGTSSGYGLYLKEASFKRGPDEPWLQVVGDARLAEMFVPYHSGSPRFWDISYNFGMVHLTREDAGAGELIGKPATVVRELRDRGLIWMDGSKGARRGERLVLWGALQAANYRYVIEYGFQDDGTINFRVGSTGRNYGSREFEGHMHNGLWRIDVNVGGADQNSVWVMEHIEPGGASAAGAKTYMRPFNKGIEGAEDWNASKFTMLQIQNDTMKNIRKMPVSYEVMPYKHGNARHYGPEREECTRHDFWVTRNRKGEMYYTRVPEYVKKGEKIMGTDVVLWLSTPGHHQPRSEDGEMRANRFVGATPLMWCGFDLRPRDVFDRSPMYP